MSKVSTVDYPQYSGGTVSLNGNDKATSYLSGNNVYSNYQMNDYEKLIYDYSQKSLSEILPQLNFFSSDTQKQLERQLNAYKTSGINTINQTYLPMLESLKNDIASRFGNFDNSMFMDNLNSIENKRASAISSFAQDVLSRQNELLNDELNRRYSLVEVLSSLQSLPLQNALSFLNLALTGSSTGNNYNSNSYKNSYSQSLQATQLNNLLNTILSGGMSTSFL